MRLPWSAVPATHQAEAERLLGGRVLRAVTQPGGSSPGVTARLALSNGRRAFVKAVGETSPGSLDMHRAEARIAAALPVSVPAARLLASLDSDGWVILIFEDVEGWMPVQPWQPAELSRVLDAMADLALTLTPSPIEAPSVAARFGRYLGRGWQQLAAASPADRDDLADLEPWTRAALHDLARLEAGWAAAAEGTTLAHGDVRADNVLLAPDRIVFVDWPWACVAQPWFDLVTMLPSVTLNGGPPPESVLAAHPVAREADPDGVTAVVAALAGMWTYLGRQPDLPGQPAVRSFRRAQGEIALAWLKARITSGG
jgi:aminoglycoside phosphotransferase (APT) family kinase protein